MNDEYDLEGALSGAGEGMGTVSPSPQLPGLASADPRSTLQMAKERMVQLTKLKEQMRKQAQARQVAMEQLAQAYSAPVDNGGMDPGLIALGRGIASAPASQALSGFTSGMQGMQEARQKLAERDWARKAAAQKIRAESEQQNMVDIMNEGKLDASVWSGKQGGHDWQMTQTAEGPAWSKIGDDGIPITKLIGGSAKDADRLIRVQSETRKRADQLDAQFLSKAGGNQDKAAQLKSEWIDSQIRSNPVTARLVPPSGADSASAMVRDIPSEKAAETRATTRAKEETSNEFEKIPLKMVETGQALRDAANSMSGLLGGFKPEFGDKGALGYGADTQLEVSAKFGLDQKAVEWWKNYKKQSELTERHALFGASLTPGEQASWASADIHPGLDAGVIKTNLETRAKLSKKVLDFATKDALALYPGSKKAIEEIYGRGGEGKPTQTHPKDIQDILNKHGKH